MSVPNKQHEWRTQPLPAGWDRIRKHVLYRDNWRCHVCERAGADQVDHVIPVAHGGGDDLHNLAAIHKSCHATKTAREANGPPRLRPPKKHPGDL